MSPARHGRTRPFRITIVHTSSILNLRGAERWVIDVSSMLAMRGLDVRVLNFDYDKRYANDRREVARRRGIVMESLGKAAITEAVALRLVLPGRFSFIGGGRRRAINEILHFVPVSPHIIPAIRRSDAVYFVYCQSTPLYLLVALLLCTVAGRKPVVAGLHANPKFRPIDQGILRFFKRIGVLRAVHIINEGQEAQIREKIGCKAVYIPNGVGPLMLGSGLTQTSPGESFEILFAGAMTAKKGADLLPEIHSKLVERGLDFKLVICTSGGPLQTAVADWGAHQSRVEFKGFVNPVEMPIAYRSANVVVIPSRGEAFPLVCIEAQACGTPVVVSDLPGFRQCVIEGSTGFFAIPGEPDSFADELQRVYELWKDDFVRYSRIRVDSSHYISESFRWTEIVPRIAAMMREAATR